MTEKTATPAMNVGIVGCGVIADPHLAAVVQVLPNAKIHLCDLNRQNAEKLAKKAPEAEIHTHFDDLINQVQLDSVHILTHVQTHFSLAQQALNAGCHVMIEKPIRVWSRLN